jgi:heat shock protein HslJ
MTALARLLFALLLTCLAMACTAGGEPPPTPIGSWLVEDIDGGGVLDSARLEINFGEDGRVSGVAGCNSFGGPFTYESGKIDVGPLLSTKMMCPPALMDMETKLLGRLEAVEQAALTDDGALELTGDGGRLLLRQAGPSRQP